MTFKDMVIRRNFISKFNSIQAESTLQWRLNFARQVLRCACTLRDAAATAAAGDRTLLASALPSAAFDSPVLLASTAAAEGAAHFALQVGGNNSAAAER